MTELPDLTLVSKALKVVYENSVAAKDREIAALKGRLGKFNKLTNIKFCNVCDCLIDIHRTSDYYDCNYCEGYACTEHGVYCSSMEGELKEFCYNCCEFDREAKRFICPLGHTHNH